MCTVEYWGGGGRLLDLRRTQTPKIVTSLYVSLLVQNVVQMSWIHWWPPPPPPPEDSRVCMPLLHCRLERVPNVESEQTCAVCAHTGKHGTYWQEHAKLSLQSERVHSLIDHSMAFPYSCSVNQGTSIQLQPNLHSIFFFPLVLRDKIHPLQISLTVAALIWHLGGWVCYEVWEIGSACSPEMDLELGQIAVYFLFWGLEWALKMNLKEL